MKRLLLLACLLPCFASATPHLYADPYPTTGPRPDSVSLTVNGGAPIACALETVAGGVQPKCPLASITTPGTYTLVMTVTALGGVSGGNTYTSPGSASSAPFTYVFRSGSASPPVVRLAP